MTTSYTYDPTHNQVTSITDLLSHTTTFSYDSQGRIQSATDALSHATTLTTNSAGQVLTVRSPLNKTTTFGYDLGDLVTVQTPLGHTTTRFLDAVGRLAQLTDALGSVTRFEYNAHDQMTKIVDPQGRGDGLPLLLTLVGPHPHSPRLDSLRSLAAAAGARRQRQPPDTHRRPRQNDDVDLRQHSPEPARSASEASRVARASGGGAPRAPKMTGSRRGPTPCRDRRALPTI